jgi:hypothetical protein
VKTPQFFQVLLLEVTNYRSLSVTVVKPVITKDVPDGLGMVTLQKERIMKNKL